MPHKKGHYHDDREKILKQIKAVEAKRTSMSQQTPVPTLGGGMLGKATGPKAVKPLSSSLSTVSSKSKKSDPYAGQGLFSPEKVEKRAEKRAKKAKSRQTADEAKTKRILARKQKKSARKGRYGDVERIEEVKKSIN